MTPFSKSCAKSVAFDMLYRPVTLLVEWTKPPFLRWPEKSELMSDTASSLGRRSLRRPTLAILLAGVAGVALAGCSLIPFNVVDTNPEDGIDSDVFSVAVGDCLNDDGVEGEITSVPKIDCSEPHDSEAYASFDLADGEYPGETAIFAEADSGCESRFEAFVGISYAESVFGLTYYFPTPEGWANGDREILCLIVDPAGKITTGSLAGAAR